jgi:hypothetical protein
MRNYFKAMREEAVDYLEKKTEAVKELGLIRFHVAKEGFCCG